MEKLLIEEKAKRYDSMFERLKEMYNNNKTNVADRLIYERYFPELKESEDERIRKELVEYFKWNAQQILNDFDNKDVLVWLEKQGEHAKFRDSIQVEDKVTRNQDGVLVNLSQLKRVAKPSDDIDTEKQSEQKQPKELTNSEFVEKCKGLSRLEQHILALVPTRPIDAIKVDARTIRYLVEQEQGEQNHTWSEEDREYMESLLDIINGTPSLTPSEVECHKDWLKSLKDRCLPQQQEWTKNDEYYRGIILYCLDGVAVGTLDKKNAISWLKSLRPLPKNQWSKNDELNRQDTIRLLADAKERYLQTDASIPKCIKWLENLSPQSHWKPSDESFNNTSCTCLSKKEAESKVWKQ